MECLLWVQSLIDVLPQVLPEQHITSHYLGPFYTETLISNGIFAWSHFISFHITSFYFKNPAIKKRMSQNLTSNHSLTKTDVQPNNPSLLSPRLYHTQTAQCIVVAMAIISDQTLHHQLDTMVHFTAAMAYDISTRYHYGKHVIFVHYGHSDIKAQRKTKAFYASEITIIHSMSENKTTCFLT